jgi:hypothetical protein
LILVFYGGLKPRPFKDGGFGCALLYAFVAKGKKAGPSTALPTVASLGMTSSKKEEDKPKSEAVIALYIDADLLC